MDTWKMADYAACMSRSRQNDRIHAEIGDLGGTDLAYGAQASAPKFTGQKTKKPPKTVAFS
jgi:hypothetical protein